MVEKTGRAWSMDADGNLFRLVSEAGRISLAYLFDPFLAVQTSTLRPLPHQIDAVYNKMLPRQPLRFLLADDPGSGKTIMAGLFCKELMIRGDVERCLVIAPGSLVEQWQDELWQKFALDFRILTKDMIEAARSGNPFDEQPLLIARLDHLSPPPVVAGAALVVPAGLLSSRRGAAARDVAEQGRARSAVEGAALDAVLAIERALGHDPVEMPPNSRGYDIESRASDGSLLFLEVKGRARGAETFTVTRSEIGVGRNMPVSTSSLSPRSPRRIPGRPVHPRSVPGYWRPSLRGDKRQPSLEVVFRPR